MRLQRGRGCFVKAAPLLLCVLLLIGVAPGVSAQQEQAPDPGAAARYRFGPLRFTPSISLTSLGVDNNVFNEAVNPKQDTTAAFGPGVDLWMRFGRSRLAGRAAVQYLYFDRYSTERAWNRIYDLKWDVPLARLTPFVTGSYANTKNRPGYEIDSRVRQASQSVGIGTDLKASPRTILRFSGRRGMVVYDDTATFQNSALAAELNQRVDVEQFMIRHALTSLTTFVVNAEALQDRFDSNRLRNANSIRVLSGFEMKTAALISGRVFVGYRRFEPLEEDLVPAFQGPVAQVDATLIARATRLNATISRDVAFSYQPTQPYYALTDYGLTLTERLGRSWDIVASGSQQSLDYQRTKAALPDRPPQADRIRQYGLGTGYRLGKTMRFGVEGVYYRRRSTDSLVNEYEGLRVGAAISYGLPQ